MFCPRQAVFSVTRNRFRNRKQLARKGVENSSGVVIFYRAPRVPRPKSRQPADSRQLHSSPVRNAVEIQSYSTRKWVFTSTKKGDDSVESSPQTGPIRHAFLPKNVLKPERYPGVRTRFSTRVHSNLNVDSDEKGKGFGTKKADSPAGNRPFLNSSSPNSQSFGTSK